jgi:alpha-glucosidase
VHFSAELMGLANAHRWWQDGIIYEIYIRSFADTDANGVGDLEGIRTRLDYLSWLGADAIWVTPFFPSPMVDGGYDVADYCGVDALFGSIDDFDRLLADAHARSLRVVLDFVPNHTSSAHPWFRASRSSRDDPKRDWYLWREPGAGGGPPNNWVSEFGGSAWELDEATGQYYYHAFAAAQPDLNWRNRDVRHAMYAAMRFWLDRGVDGFRVDVMWHLIKDARFRDDPEHPDDRDGRGAEYRRLIHAYSSDQPDVHEVVAEMRDVLDEYDDRLMIGEIYLPIDRLVDYYGRDGRGAHLPFNFHLITTPWDARQIEAIVGSYEGMLPPSAWPNWVLGNHDQPRVASRIGDAQARVAAVLLLTLRGTPTIYYGEELGLRNVDIPPERIDDVHERREPGRHAGRRVQRRHTMASARGGEPGAERGSPARRRDLDAVALPPPHRPAAPRAGAGGRHLSAGGCLRDGPRVPTVFRRQGTARGAQPWRRAAAMGDASRLRRRQGPGVGQRHGGGACPPTRDRAGGQPGTGPGAGRQVGSRRSGCSPGLLRRPRIMVAAHRTGRELASPRSRHERPRTVA